jgi:hypothetical protein
MKAACLLLFCAVLIVASRPINARIRNAKATQIANVQLPADYGLDLQLASTARPTMLGGNAPILETPLNSTGQKVFDSLVGNTAVSAINLPYQWELILVRNSVVDAASTAGGKVYVYGGLANLLGSNRGLWAAVLSHEIAHTALRHQVRDYLARLYIAEEIQYLRLQARAGNRSANWALIGFGVAAPIALKKMERDQEHEADIQGMMLMARAGYHPDFVFALHHLLEMTTGDQSKLGAFFSDHPRWVTRDQRSDRAYADALAQYNALWSDSSSSPGGLAPFVAFLDQPSVTEDKRARVAHLSLPLYCRNSSEPVTVIVDFDRKGSPVPAGDNSFRDEAGNLRIIKTIICPTAEDSSPVDVEVPASALADRDRKLRAQVIVAGPNLSKAEESKAFDVHIPKP